MLPPVPAYNNQLTIHAGGYQLEGALQYCFSCKCDSDWTPQSAVPCVATPGNPTISSGRFQTSGTENCATCHVAVNNWIWIWTSYGCNISCTCSDAVQRVMGAVLRHMM